MTSTSDVELRSVIKFCVALNKSPTETLKMVKSAGKYDRCSPAVVYKWHSRFKSGRESIQVDPRSGRPSIAGISMKERVRDIVNTDRRTTVRAIAVELDISCSTVHGILTDGLDMSKVSARWVPRLLTDVEKERRVRSSQNFLSRYAAEGDEFLDRIITTDETWLHHFDPETKAMSSVWKTPRTPPPKKARVQRSAGKHMFIFFMDRYGMLLQHRVPDGQTVTAAYYSKVLRRDLVNAIRKKRPRMDLERVILHQDNAPGHRAVSTQIEISFLGFEVLEHPPYSPDLAPMDFRVFPELKASLRGIKFDSVDELTKQTQIVVSSFSEAWYAETYAKWVNRHNKCVDISGDYVEKVRRSLDLNDA